MTKLGCACKEYIHRPDYFSIALTWAHEEHVANTLRRVFGEHVLPPISDKDISDVFLYWAGRGGYQVGQCPECGRLVLSPEGADVFFPLTDLLTSVDLEADMCAHDPHHPSYTGLGTCRCGVRYSAKYSGVILSETGYSRFFGGVDEHLRSLPHSPQDVSPLAADIAQVSRRFAFGLIFTCMSCQSARVVSKDERLLISGLYCRDAQQLL